MKPSSSVPTIKDLVLIGGGHSHLFVLKYFAMNPVPGVRLTLITRDLHTPYSGMLPGYIAGHYSYDQSHIDLRPLAQLAGARIYHAEVNALHLETKKIICPGRPPIHYDFASINIGSTPSTLHTPGARQHTISVKPINLFLSKWDELVNELTTALQQKKSFRLSIVGGGAGGIEMALAAQYRLHHLLKLKNISTNKLEIHLYCDTVTILPSHNSQTREIFYRILKERNINIHTQQNIINVDKNRLTSIDGSEFYTDSTLWITNASAPAWLSDSGLEVDDKGFIAVNDCLQSVSHGNIFAAGDIASVINYPREKSGVFAVRQGLPLAKNLARIIQKQPIKSFKPQSKFLGLISTGNKYAIASRGNWSFEGAFLWKVKDWIDQKFMQKFNHLPEMQEENPHQYNHDIIDKSDNKITDELSLSEMRCGGCGAKVSQKILSRVIERLEPLSRDDVIIGLSDPDDAAVSQIPADKLIVQSVDYFRSFIDDPFLFGQIAANHALNDIYAMGAETQTALAIVTIPFGLESQVEDQLFQTMAGAVKILNESNTALIGGHSSEGAELSFGLSVTGYISKNQLMRKSGMQSGDVLILTKALGSGTLFAADMRLRAKGRWIDNAIDSMLQSNQAASICLHKHGATACTDITGFGLLGHLVEMTHSTNSSESLNMCVDINLDVLPILDGAFETMTDGIFSSLQEKNLQSSHVIKDLDNFTSHPHFPLLFDPQTSGGLLAAIPAQNADKCLSELNKLGYSKSIPIGVVTGKCTAMDNVSLVTI